MHNISYDSRKVKPGDTFVAIPGYKVDGYDFIPQAIANGATTIVMSNDKCQMTNEGVNFILVDNPRQALAELAAEYYGHPAKKLKLIGITGTNGKTTVAYLIESILSKAGYKTGMIGTVETKIAGKSVESKLTTPGSLELQALLAQMVKEGVTHVVMEVSSHSLAQYRVFGCEFDAVIFTNLTHDHLDYHGTMERYLEDKKKLFAMLKPRGAAIINVDDPYHKEIASVVETEVNFYGIKDARHELRTSKHTSFEGNLQEYNIDREGMRVRIDTTEMRTSLVGEFNVYNILAAFQCGLYFKVGRDIIKKGIEGAFVPGRLEKIESGKGFAVYIDFAHTPDALKKVLQVLSPLAKNNKGKLIVVFGCPGDRDKEKRPVMGQIAMEIADQVIVTTDDPHSEEPAKIIEEIMPSAQCPMPNMVGVLDRKEAIQKALSMAEKGDIVLIAGRGHEKVQDFNGVKVALDDKDVVSRYFA